MREIRRELPLSLPPEAAFSLLHAPSAIREWWSAARAIVAARAGGLWVAAWGSDEDHPDYVAAARILVWEPPNTLRLGEFEYSTRDGQGLPFEASLETEFTVS
ncbi:MAG: SRPBCC domain-containing protein, partial [Tepidiformaceae bacterium]